MPATLSSKDKGVTPFHETWGLTNLSLIHLAGKDPLLRAAEEYGNASSTLSSAGLGGHIILYSYMSYLFSILHQPPGSMSVRVRTPD